MKVVITDQVVLAAWLNPRITCTFDSGATYIGQLDTETGEILFAVRFDSYNGASIIGHFAAVPGKRWLTKELLWFTFYYPFVQLGVQRLTGLVLESNHEARRFDEHLGFTFEAALERAHPDGNLLVYRMFREDCRWLNLKRGSSWAESQAHQKLLIT